MPESNARHRKDWTTDEAIGPTAALFQFELARDGALSFQESTASGSGLRRVTLLLRGTPLYETGYGCESCRALYSAAGCPPTPLTPTELSNLLAGELTEVTGEIIETVKPLLPGGRYVVGLLRAIPRLIRYQDQHPKLNSEAEQILKDDPGEKRESSAAEPAKPDHHWICREMHTEGLFGSTAQGGRDFPWIKARTEDEVLLPHRASGTCDRARVWDYTISDVWMHSVLALSLIEDRDWGCKHWHSRLTHFLLDGHHKTMAASEHLKPLQILSFLNLSHSDSTTIGDLTIRKFGDYHRRRPKDWLCDGEDWERKRP